MNKEEKHLVGCKVELIYQKSDIFKAYRRFTDNVAIDNEILDNEDMLYITTLDKYNKLQQENKQLKDNWNKIEQIIENERMSHWAPSPLFLTELLSKMQELEQGSNSNVKK